MAKSQAADGDRRRRESHSSLDSKKLCKSRGKEPVTQELNAAELRRIRIDRLESGTSAGRGAEVLIMASESRATLHSLKSGSGHRRRRDHPRESEEKKHRRRKKSPEREEGPTYVYGPPADKPRLESFWGRIVLKTLVREAGDATVDGDTKVKVKAGDVE
ncbi:hypothetical protein ACEPPN_017040 [Leptodophora sp. 'Broadleaf-Isolate-01']